MKWENYETPTWEPSGNLPAFITNYYEKTGKSSIPSARVKHTKLVGGSKFHLLVLDSPDGEKYIGMKKMHSALKTQRKMKLTLATHEK